MGLRIAGFSRLESDRPESQDFKGRLQVSRPCFHLSLHSRHCRCLGIETCSELQLTSSPFFFSRPTYTFFDGASRTALFFPFFFFNLLHLSHCLMDLLQGFCADKAMVGTSQVAMQSV